MAYDAFFDKEYPAAPPRLSRLLNAVLLLAVAGAVAAQPASAKAADATALLRAGFHNWRGNTSETVMTMTVHHPNWQRHLTMKTWTRGMDDALVRFTAPAKDAGNATLKLGAQTWVYNPKLNQVIRLPASLLSQSWMGSDFSYNDLSKADDVVTEYNHKITSTKASGTHSVYTVQALPKPGAPVIWGKIVVKVRDDGVFLGETYFDQDMNPVRVMTTEKVGMLGGRAYPEIIKMQPTAKPGEWTELTTKSAVFDQSQPGYLYTRSNLQNARG